MNFKNLTEQLGFRGRQEHYNAYVEDFVIRQQEDGSEVVEFREGPTKTRSGGLTISRRTTPQAMYSTDGGKTDPVRKRNKISSSLVYILHETQNKAFSRRSRAKTEKKCTKKHDTRAKLLFCLLNQLFFFTFSLPSASLDLKVHILLTSPSSLLFKSSLFSRAPRKKTKPSAKP